MYNTKNDREIAHAMLTALCESSIVDELKYYKNDIQRDLLLTTEHMDRLYNLKSITDALKPEPEVVRYYKGRKVQDDKPLFQFSFLSGECMGNTASELNVEPDQTQSLRVEEPSVDIKLQEVPVQEVPVQEVPVQEVPVQEVPVQEVPVQEVPVLIEQRKVSRTGAHTAMEKILVDIGIDLEKVVIDSDKHVKIMIVHGLENFTEHDSIFTDMGGKYKPKFGGWAFNKVRVLRYNVERKAETMPKTPRADSDEIDDPEKEESD